MKSLLLVIALATTQDALAKSPLQIETKFGGWSSHVITNETTDYIRDFIDPDFEYNESHRGIGIKFSKQIHNSDWAWTVEYWHMTESYRMPLNAYSIGVERRWKFKDFDASIVIPFTHQSRGRVYYGVNSATNEAVTARFARGRFNYPTPYLSLYKGPLNIDIAAIPGIGFDTKTSLTLFLRAGFRFSL